MYKKSILTLLLALTLVACGGSGGGTETGGGSGQAVNISGIWTGEIKGDSGPFVAVLTVNFTQNGSSLSGTFTISSNTCAPAGGITGTINASTVAFSLAASNGSTSSLTAVVSGNTMTGTYQGTGGTCADTGTFSISR